ncbi:MAG: amidophosphoribosyltransferase, partial [Bacteroidales bacterium]
FESKWQQQFSDPIWAKQEVPFAGEVYIGHLRYGTFGSNGIESIHPVLRQNNWKTRNLLLAGNFNLTNMDEIFQRLVDLGQFPTELSDTVTILENVGHFLDRQNQRLFDHFKEQGFSNVEISALIANALSTPDILRESSKKWDGGYVIGGIIGHGEMFAYRDPWGIRPAFYYCDDEVVVVASERAVIQTAFGVDFGSVLELDPGSALVVKHSGSWAVHTINTPQQRAACSFERIYFSRGSDQEIYRERKRLGEALVPAVLNAVGQDLAHAVFSYIPNTAEVAYMGLISGLETYLMNQKISLLTEGDSLGPEEARAILRRSVRTEKVAIKDVKMRTFISDDKGRNTMVGHVYDVTWGSIQKGTDTLVILDDSIVRGTTLRKSIIGILDKLGPKKIVIVSSAPQIRYPDCYGIDMARLGDFIAFQATMALLREQGKGALIERVYQSCLAQAELPKEEVTNAVAQLYAPFTDEEISAQIARMLKLPGTNADIEVVFQTVEGLHKACPDHSGDWYFTGNYPTPGGNKVANRSFVLYMEGLSIRPY